jgi:methionine synthase II (cobalamin-independent)
MLLTRLNSYKPFTALLIGDYMLDHASRHLDAFGPDDIAEMQEDAVTAAVHDQCSAELDVITDGEQTRLDFNLSFYGFLEGIDLEGASFVIDGMDEYGVLVFHDQHRLTPSAFQTPQVST